MDVGLGRPKPFSAPASDATVMAVSPDERDPATGLRAHSTSPGKTVFTEPDNEDGWLATDYTVDVER